MIIVQLNGGLGNQLFQYATARRLSLHLGVPLKLDIKVFEEYALRVYELGNFNIDASIATLEEIAQLCNQSLLARTARRLGLKTSYVKEKGFHFNSRIMNLSDSSYLEGYWQSYRYFEDQADVIRQELTVKSPLIGVNKALFDRMSGSDSICLHVRRGDYVSNSQTNQYHGTCSLEYYHQAMRQLQEKLREPELFVFSDDIPWAKEHIVFDLPTTYVDQNTAKNAYDDLRLMTACKHFVIANSSFSWWGAWLASYKNKEVYAPKKWFADQSINTQDLIPATWHRL
jgi:hypothetical protein